MNTLRKAFSLATLCFVGAAISLSAMANGPSTGLDESLNPSPKIQQQQEPKEKYPALDLQEQKAQEPDKEVVKEAQHILREKGLFIGFATGSMDSKTERALKTFQKQENLPVTGMLDDKTLAALKKEKKPKNEIQAQEEAMER